MPEFYQQRKNAPEFFTYKGSTWILWDNGILENIASKQQFNLRHITENWFENNFLECYLLVIDQSDNTDNENLNHTWTK